MADNPTNPGVPGAIPPKAVPPTFRAPSEAASAEGAASSAPRTVRLKPITVASSGSSLPAAAKPAAASAAGSLDATEAIKRMTARIAILSGEGEPAVGKKRTGQISGSGVDPMVKKATAGLSGVLADPNPTVKRMTSRIQMPSQTAQIPDIAGLGPKTIKVKPVTVTQGGTQQIAQAELSGAVAAPKATGKIGTSRIPLESAMSVPPQESAASADGAAPKTIKLKRPGEMSTVKVSVMGAKAVPESAAAAAAAAAVPGAVDAAANKKTIRVKRPNAPVAGGVTTGEEAVGAEVAGTPMAPPMGFAPVAPERGTGWFIAVAAACIILVIGLGCLYAVQLYGGRPNTELDQSFQQN